MMAQGSASSNPLAWRFRRPSVLRSQKLRGESTTVALFVLIVGLLNVGLGYALAVALASDGPWFALPHWFWTFATLPLQRLGRLAPSPPVSANGPTIVPSANRSAENSPATGAEVTLDDLPRGWLEELQNENFHVESFIEGFLQSLKLEVGKYREQLIVAEGRLKQSQASRSTDSLALLASDLRVINQDWLERLHAAANLLREKRGCLGEFEGLCQGIEPVLHDQAGQVDSICANIASLTPIDDFDAATKTLAQHLCQLVDLAHVLRDRMHASVATMLRTQGRLQGLNRDQQIDECTGLINRTGIELLFDDWWKDDPQRLRLLSCAVIDIDRFGKLNERLGTRTGDRVLNSLGRVLADMVRKDRWFDRFARLGGQSFLLFYGDIGPRNASVAADRVRQTLEAVTFDYHGNKFELSVSCGVLEVGNMEGIDDVLARLAAAAKEAKRAGRNRTALDEGEGAKAIEPPKYEVQGKIVQVDEDQEVAVTVG
jgi:diguanylate cyclase